MRYLLIFILCSTCWGAEYTNIYLDSGRYIEQVVFNPARTRTNNALGNGYPDITLYAPGGDPSAPLEAPRITSADYDPSTTEAMDLSFHPVHQISTTGNLYVDVHYSMATANAGNVTWRLDIWRLDENDDISSLSSMGTADVTTTWTMNPVDTARTYDYNFFEVPYSGAIQGDQIGVVDLSSISNGFQSEWLVKFSRDAGNALDTHTGDVSLYRLEFHFPVEAKWLATGN